MHSMFADRQNHTISCLQSKQNLQDEYKIETEKGACFPQCALGISSSSLPQIPLAGGRADSTARKVSSQETMWRRSDYPPTSLPACPPGSQALQVGALISLAALARMLRPVASSPVRALCVEDHHCHTPCLVLASHGLNRCPSLYVIMCPIGFAAEPTSQLPCVYEMNHVPP